MIFKLLRGDEQRTVGIEFTRVDYCGNREQGWVCTRLPGHSGLHYGGWGTEHSGACWGEEGPGVGEW